MKCDKCFFCLHIGKGIYADYPVKYCRHLNIYKLPFMMFCEDGELKQRQLDFSKISDCKIWHDVGCDIHWKTVKKAKEEYMRSLEEEKR